MQVDMGSCQLSRAQIGSIFSCITSAKSEDRLRLERLNIGMSDMTGVDPAVLGKTIVGLQQVGALQFT